MKSEATDFMIMPLDARVIDDSCFAASRPPSFEEQKFKETVLVLGGSKSSCRIEGKFDDDERGALMMPIESNESV
jgi:hypothetical protein